MTTLKVMQGGSVTKSKPVQDPGFVYSMMKFLRKEDREKLYALHLDAKSQIIAKELLSVGTLTSSAVHPRETFKGALLNNACSVILVHNHPSGDAAPSADDVTVTERLIQAGDLLGVPVQDHIIVGSEGFRSFKLDGGWRGTRSQMSRQGVNERPSCKEKEMKRRKQPETVQALTLEQLDTVNWKLHVGIDTLSALQCIRDCDEETLRGIIATLASEAESRLREARDILNPDV